MYHVPFSMQHSFLVSVLNKAALKYTHTLKTNIIQNALLIPFLILYTQKP